MITGDAKQVRGIAKMIKELPAKTIKAVSIGLMTEIILDASENDDPELISQLELSFHNERAALTQREKGALQVQNGTPSFLRLAKGMVESTGRAPSIQASIPGEVPGSMSRLAATVLRGGGVPEL